MRYPSCAAGDHHGGHALTSCQDSLAARRSDTGQSSRSGVRAKGSPCVRRAGASRV